MRLTPNNIAIRRRKISCSTQLLPTIVNHIVNKFPASEAAVVFETEWENWRGEQKQTDDVLMIGIKF